MSEELGQGERPFPLDHTGIDGDGLVVIRERLGPSFGPEALRGGCSGS